MVKGGSIMRARATSNKIKDSTLERFFDVVNIIFLSYYVSNSFTSTAHTICLIQ